MFERKTQDRRVGVTGQTFQRRTGQKVKKEKVKGLWKRMTTVRKVLVASGPWTGGA